MSAFNLVYPSPAAMKEILPDLVNRDRASRVGLQLLPVVSSPTFHVRWIQKDNQYGLMQMRGLDGQPPHVQRVGQTSFLYEPGVYGEHILITEREILTRASTVNPETPIPIGDLVMEADQQLIGRLDDRMEANVWDLLIDGILNVSLPGPNGPQVYSDTYTIQTYTASVPWATTATATPLANFQAVQQKQVGHGCSFGSDAVAYMNQVTANYLLNNANASDYSGRRDQYGATLNNLTAFNNYFQGQNLPRVAVYDAGYQLAPVSGVLTAPSTQFQKFIPDNKVIVVGTRPGGQPIGHVQQTIQAMQPDGGASAGEYRFVKDSTKGLNCALSVPPKVEIHRGWNGGPTLEYGTAVVVMSV